MNWKQIAAALGITVSANVSDDAIRALVLKELKLAPEADELSVYRALMTAQAARKATRGPAKVVARGAWWTIQARGKDVAELLIYGSIGESFFGESVSARELVQQLADVEARTINVRINSDGGSVNDGIAIYNALRKHGARIEVDVDGAAFSIASMIAMAGDVVRMPDNALLMVHAPHGFAAGNAVEMREFAGVLDMYAQAMQHAYVNKVGQTKASEIRDLLNDGENHFFTAQEAEAFGFVDEITSALAIAASFDRASYPNLPAVAAAFTRKESQMNWKAIAKALGLPETADVATIKAKLVSLGLDPESATVEQIAAKLATPAPAPSPAVTGETAEQVQARITARNREITAVFAKFRARPGVADLERDVLADAGITAAAAHNRLLTHLGDAAEPLNPAGSTSAGETSDEKRRSAMVLATLVRAGIKKDPDTQKDIVFDGANPYRGLTLREIARAAFRSSGRNPDGMDAMEIARAVLVRAAGGQTTSDFPVFLENTLHKMVLLGFQTTPASYQRFCKVGSVTDLRAWNRIVPSMIANLEAVNEAGEYRNKNLPDGEKEAVQAKRRGNIIEVTPETIINDDLAAITDMARALGAAGPRTVDRLVFALLAQNANLGPTLVKTGQTLIHANHGNTNTGVASVSKLATMAEKMQLQTLPGADAEKLDIGPSVSLSRPTVAGDIQVIVESQYDHEGTKLQQPNKVRGLLKDVVGTARMPATIFYLFADPNVAPVIEVVFLDGIQQVRVVTEENFRTAGLAWRGELNVGAGAIDYRGIQYRTGA